MEKLAILLTHRKEKNMAMIRDINIQRENAAVAGILLQLEKREEKRQRLWWLLGIAGLAIIILILIIILM